MPIVVDPDVDSPLMTQEIFGPVLPVISVESVDDAIDIDYRLDTGGRSSEGIISSYRREERRFLIDATSHHATPIGLTILDQLPVPQDERIEVEMLDDTTPPTVTDDDDRRGVLAWTRTLAPGENMKLMFGYAVTWPEDLRIDGF